MIKGSETFNPLLSPDDIEFDAPPGWHRMKDLLQPALDRENNTYRLEDVKEEIQQGKAQYWPGEHCVVVTRIVSYPQKKLLLYWLGGGDLEEILGMEDLISDFGRQHGCEASVLHGRKGWAKVLPSWTIRSVNYYKEL